MQNRNTCCPTTDPTCGRRQNIVSEEPANKNNYAYVLKVNDKHMAYKVTYTSDNETFGYHSATDWFQYLTTWKKEVGKPVVVNVIHKE